MKITADRKHLIEKLGRAAVVAPKRSAKEILTRILLVASSDSAEAFATDMEVAIALGIECDVAKEGRSLLPAKVLAVLRECTDETVVIESDDSSVSVSCGTANLTFQVEKSEEFPRPRFDEPDVSTEVSSEALSQAIDRTSYACDEDSARFALGGVLFESDGSSLLLVATDGRRLSRVTISIAEGRNGIQDNQSCIVPKRALESINKLESDGTVLVWSTNSEFHVKGEGIRLSARLVEGRFPNWRQVIPNIENHLRAEAASASFERAIKQSAIVTDAETRGIEMMISSGRMAFAASAADIGKSHVSIPVKYEGADVTVRVDYRYMLDFLKQSGDNSVIAFTESNAPIVMLSGDNYINIVMPMAKD